MSLGKEFINSSKFVLIGTYSNVFSTLLISIILARLLDPKIFGTMAIISLVLSFFQMLGDAGMGTAFVQLAHRMKQEDRSGALFFLLLVSIVLSVILYLSSTWIEILFAFDNLSHFLEIISPLLIVSVLAGAFKSMLISSKEFLKVNLINVIGTLISGIIGIILAFNGYGIYALVDKMYVYQLFLLVLYGWFIRNRLSLQIQVKIDKEFWSYTVNGMYNQALGFMMKNFDTLLVGKFLGNESLGLYNVSFKLMRQPVSTLAKVFTPVIQPVFREGDDVIIFSAYFRFSRFIGLLGFVISLVFMVWGDKLFILVYGEKWLLGAPIFRVMSISIFFHLLLSGVGGLMLARRHQSTLSKSMTLSFLSVIVFIMIGVSFGNLYILSWFYVLSVFVNFIQSYYYLFRNVLRESISQLFVKGKLALLVRSYILFVAIFSIVQIQPTIQINDMLSRLVFSALGIVMVAFISDSYNFVQELKYVLGRLRNR